MLRLLGVLLVVFAFASAARAQRSFQMEAKPEEGPLVTPPKPIRFVEAEYPKSESEAEEPAVVELDIVIGSIVDVNALYPSLASSRASIASTMTAESSTS